MGASRRLVVVAATVAVGAATVTSCAGGGSSGRGAVAAATPAAARARTAGCVPAGDPARRTGRHWSVGRTSLTLVDTGRPTDAEPARHLARKPNRTLPVIVSYPIPTPPGADPRAPAVAGAAPAPGRFPLIVLSHGVTSSGTVTAALAAPFVRAGYVVATPTYPLSSGPGGLINDLPNQPGDVSFVITRLEARAAAPGGPLSGHLAPGCIAVAGHSLGAVTTLAAAYLSCCRDSRIKAVVSFAGVLAPFKGTFADAPPIPLLLVHGEADKTVPVKGSRDAFATLRGPRYLVTLHGADHITIFTGDAGKTLYTAVVGFLDGYLKGDTAALRNLPKAMKDSGLATYRSAP